MSYKKRRIAANGKIDNRNLSNTKRGPGRKHLQGKLQKEQE